MVTANHEASHRIFQERPELLEPVFRILGVPLPRNAVVEVLSADATEIRPLERRVDSVLRIEPPDGSGGLLLAIEAQGRRDGDKAVSWAYYLAYLKAKYDCPALLLVVCQDKATADWAAGPFDLGPDGWTALSVHPLVLGPGNVPPIIDPEEAAQDLAMATFSAMTHGRSQDAPAILDALARALGTADKESVAYYSELLEIGLGESPARKTWRNLMIRTYFPGRGTLIEETLLEGEAKGSAQMVLRVLEKRGILVPAETRERITSCTDLHTLERWMDRALTVSTADELFEDES
ncbi:hypothetical protein AF335_03025 [Streptomyces eurocidicus]|uniref:Uncharacterized protein n=1 Tax=Streptomyces eurocidicus TaxID=66423 RepID=A0A2N8P2W7_STREU|nr:hypothetical protein [Streptomyces eurocidicus]MBB5117499.1 hypothetical protein [Streptomyces eurocidicus]MBF6053341.1 hypothetical protein [Streptomyces eurocidicus]PNE35341.1 hypothetical protein AF335_03025 [Streptomyces eurocidicus]